VKLLTGLPEPRGLLPAPDLSTVEVTEQWWTDKYGLQHYRMVINGRPVDSNYWHGKPPFVILNTTEWPF
jgi:hypothetical protein